MLDIKSTDGESLIEVEMQEGDRKEPNWISNLIFLDDKELVKD